MAAPKKVSAKRPKTQVKGGINERHFLEGGSAQSALVTKLNDIDRDQLRAIFEKPVMHKLFDYVNQFKPGVFFTDSSNRDKCVDQVNQMRGWEKYHAIVLAAQNPIETKKIEQTEMPEEWPIEEEIRPDGKSTDSDK